MIAVVGMVRDAPRSAEGKRRPHQSHRVRLTTQKSGRNSRPSAGYRLRGRPALPEDTPLPSTQFGRPRRARVDPGISKERKGQAFPTRYTDVPRPALVPTPGPREDAGLRDVRGVASPREPPGRGEPHHREFFAQVSVSFAGGWHLGG